MAISKKTIAKWKDWAARRAGIVKLRKSSLTLKEIGQRYDISAERVRQILKAEAKHDR